MSINFTVFVIFEICQRQNPQKYKLHGTKCLNGEMKYAKMIFGSIYRSLIPQKFPAIWYVLSLYCILDTNQ